MAREHYNTLYNKFNTFRPITFVLKFEHKIKIYKTIRRNKNA